MREEIKKTAIRAARLAGTELKKRFLVFDRKNVELKAKHDILTPADLAAEKIILKEIKKNFSDHRILSEEEGEEKRKSDYFWIIDPLDGTTNFSMHNPLFSVSIGVAFKNKLILGVIYAPFLDELWVAEAGKGAYLNNKKLKISAIKNKHKVIHAFCHGSGDKSIKKAMKYYENQKLKELDCRQLGSAAIELAYVATGRIESIVIPGVHPWDVAAGALILKEAGGKVTDFNGKNWDLNSNDILGSNKTVYDEVFKTINK